MCELYEKRENLEKKLTKKLSFVIISEGQFFSVFWMLLKNGYFLSSEGGNNMSKTVVRKNESLDDALRRFKRSVSKTGTLQEYRKREYYEKPSVKRKKKSEAARKRKKF